jgi:hypothetical protein
VNTIAIGHRPGIVMNPIPGPVIKTCPIVYTAHIRVGMYIARCITHIYHLGCGIIDIYVLDIIDW